VLVLGLSDLRPLGDLRVDPKSEDISLSPDGRELVVSHNDNLLAIGSGDLDSRRANLDIIGSPASIVTGTANLRRLKLCVAPAALTYAADGARAYVACTGEDTLAVVDTQNARVVTTVPAGTGPTNKPIALVADERGESLLVSNQISRTLVLFSASDAPVIKWSAWTNGSIPAVAAWLPGDRADHIVVPLQDPSGAALVSAVDGTVIRMVTYSDEKCLNPNEAKPYADGRVFLVCQSDHYMPGSVVQIDPETLEIKGRAQVGAYPDRLALLPPADAR
jgi:YVTN family beta-propeller protein